VPANGKSERSCREDLARCILAVRNFLAGCASSLPGGSALGGALTLFRILDIPVRVHASWLVIYGLIAWSLSAGYFPQVLPDVSARTHWVSRLVAALLLFISVFLHELSHSVVARRHGLPVATITLHVFGGVSELGREPESPGVEFRIAVVGPLTSFALGGLGFVAVALVGDRATLAAILRYPAVRELCGRGIQPRARLSVGRRPRASRRAVACEGQPPVGARSSLWC
jgi:hypothetical protein